MRRFLLRGLEKVEVEWHLMAAKHNLLKLFRNMRSQQRLALAAGGRLWACGGSRRAWNHPPGSNTGCQLTSALD